MIQLVENNLDHGYNIYRSSAVVDHAEDLVKTCSGIHDKFKRLFPNRDSTWNYNLYNVFSLVGADNTFFYLYKDIIAAVKDYVKIDGPMWMQCWMNYHKPHEVLDWHDHNFPCHGYVAVDAKESKTVFENYEIFNTTGNIYIGPGHRKHKVEVLKIYKEPRVTLGFDIRLEPQNLNNQSSISWIPVL